MTTEEAAEEILKGPFRRCEKCKGTGVIDEYQIHDEISSTICNACLGAGQLHRKEYVCAALFLNLKVPDYPQNTKDFQERAIERISDMAMRKLLPKMRQQGIRVDSTILDELQDWKPATFQVCPTHFGRMTSSQPNLLTWDKKKPPKKY